VLLAVPLSACTFGGDAASDEPAVIVQEPIIEDTEFEGCYECHPDIDVHRSIEGRSTLNLDHAEHAAAAGGEVRCASCHPLNTHVGTSTVLASMETCFACHGASAEHPLNCSACHPLSALPSPLSHHDDEWGRSHGIPLLDEEMACSTCHTQPDFCSSCHGVEMPHPDDYEAVHVNAWEAEGTETCDTCHSAASHGTARSDCDTCHHPGGDPDDPWIVAHSGVADEDGTAECSTCHAQEQFCTACHGVELPHPAGWTGTDHAVAFIDDQDGCTTCHDVTGEDAPRSECDTCHHPGGDQSLPWIIAHRASLVDGTGQCFTCHVTSTCVSCHVDGIADFSGDWERILDLSR
jgi:hypothetical protein